MVPPRPEMDQVAVVQFPSETKGLGAAHRWDAPWIILCAALHDTCAIEHGADGDQPVMLIPLFNY